MLWFINILFCPFTIAGPKEPNSATMQTILRQIGLEFARLAQSQMQLHTMNSHGPPELRQHRPFLTGGHADSVARHKANMEAGTHSYRSCVSCKFDGMRYRSDGTPSQPVRLPNGRMSNQGQMCFLGYANPARQRWVLLVACCHDTYVCINNNTYN